MLKNSNGPLGIFVESENLSVFEQIASVFKCSATSLSVVPGNSFRRICSRLLIVVSDRVAIVLGT